MNWQVLGTSDASDVDREIAWALAANGAKEIPVNARTAGESR
jgi:hypothetical protein